MKKVIPRAAIIGIASGLLLMAFFTFAWLGIAESGLEGVWSSMLAIIFSIFALSFAINGVYLLIVSKRFQKLSTVEGKAEGKRIGKWFGIIFGTEGVVIGITAGILNATNHYNFFFPALALIVGLHFYPMARIFKRKVDYYIATWSCGVAIVGLVLTFNGTSTNTVAVFVGMGLAISTSLYGLYMMLAGRKILNASED